MWHGATSSHRTQRFVQPQGMPCYSQHAVCFRSLLSVCYEAPTHSPIWLLDCHILLYSCPSQGAPQLNRTDASDAVGLLFTHTLRITKAYKSGLRLVSPCFVPCGPYRLQLEDCLGMGLIPGCVFVPPAVAGDALPWSHLEQVPLKGPLATSPASSLCCAFVCVCPSFVSG